MLSHFITSSPCWTCCVRLGSEKRKGHTLPRAHLSTNEPLQTASDVNYHHPPEGILVRLRLVGWSLGDPSSLSKSLLLRRFGATGGHQPK